MSMPLHICAFHSPFTGFKLAFFGLPPAFSSIQETSSLCGLNVNFMPRAGTWSVDYLKQEGSSDHTESLHYFSKHTQHLSLITIPERTLRNIPCRWNLRNVVAADGRCVPGSFLLESSLSQGPELDV